MDRLTEMEAFVQVVDHGGFTEAAQRMGVSKSAVSKHVAALEARLTVRLLPPSMELLRSSRRWISSRYGRGCPARRERSSNDPNA